MFFFLSCLEYVNVLSNVTFTTAKLLKTLALNCVGVEFVMFSPEFDYIASQEFKDKEHLQVYSFPCTFASGPFKFFETFVKLFFPANYTSKKSSTFAVVLKASMFSGRHYPFRLERNPFGTLRKAYVSKRSKFYSYVRTI